MDNLKFIPIRCDEPNIQAVLGISDEVLFTSNQPILLRGEETGFHKQETLEPPKVKYIKCPFYDSENGKCIYRMNHKAGDQSKYCIYAGEFDRVKEA